MKHEEPRQEFVLSCPVETIRHDKVLLAHGGGGRLSHSLLKDVVLPGFQNEFLKYQPDAARINTSTSALAITTDSFVVKPLFFPGGNIGNLAVTGTINDLAMMGAKPRFLSCAFILEEGLDIAVLHRIVEEMAKAAQDCGTLIVTGDTKVVEKGCGDGIFINTTGIGERRHDLRLGPEMINPGDVIILSGDIGRHGTAILCAREEINMDAPILSDCTNLWPVVEQLLDHKIPINCMRDLTRGGLASALVEISQSAGKTIEIDESRLPVHPRVRSVCEMFGLEPWHLANEGRFITILPEWAAEKALKVLKKNRVGEAAEVIGTVGDSARSQVLVKTPFGITQPLMLLSGDPIPRIC